MAQSKSKPTKAAAQQLARQQAREEAARLKAAQAAKERRLKLISLGIGLGIVVAAVIVVVLVLQNTKGPGYADVAAKPLGANEAGSLVIGQDLKPGGAPAAGDNVPVLRLYSDYMCPGCGEVDRRLATKLQDLASNGEVKLEVQPVSFLDRLSQGTDYSTRAANAAFTVAQYAPDQFLAFHNELFASDVQPKENTEGLSNEKLAEIAQSLGVPADVTDRFEAGEFNSWVDYTTGQAQKQPVETTPSMWLGTSDDDLTLIDNPISIDLDTAIARVNKGQDPN
ncbi:MAG: thioredoxin domain-containing protein [Bifidobacteriaceae bacterium]|jgi:protein-disulfide isomerase|nr:thioredoxin domain-containing protein [Bifidobacteriaceae bacterium]